MTQSTVPIPEKSSGAKLTAVEFNSLVSAVNNNATEVDSKLLSPNLTTVETSTGRYFSLAGDIPKNWIEEFSIGGYQSAIHIGSSCRTIHVGAFDNDLRVSSLTFGEGCVVISRAALSGLINIMKIPVVLPDSLIYIGENAFMSSAIGSVEFGENLEYIDGSAFRLSAVGSLEFPDSLKVLGHGAFYSCSGLQTVEFGAGTVELGGGVFGNCANLNSIRAVGTSFVDYNNGGSNQTHSPSLLNNTHAMTYQKLNQFLTDLAPGDATLNFSSCGEAQLMDISIATAKGYTVII